jgi:hypothetical protein
MEIRIKVRNEIEGVEWVIFGQDVKSTKAVVKFAKLDLKSS